MQQYQTRAPQTLNSFKSCLVKINIFLNFSKSDWNLDLLFKNKILFKIKNKIKFNTKKENLPNPADKQLHVG